MPSRRRAVLILLLLAAAAIAGVAASLATGSLPLGPLDVLRALCFDEAGLGGAVVRNLRLPRALAGLACGGLLA
ncbi:MAG: iron ABC transporter permease, partial [Proteobacteria bacterium]|nr:iron ABC transporter permease [Pseudomonadota bacterium]